MFPPKRVKKSLKKYNIKFTAKDSDEKLIQKLADFYAKRTLTEKDITPESVVEASCFLLSTKADRISGHIIPVDGGLKEAFLR
jgi:enoyl-[acyl-carrier-protein] reductase (NADH)